MIKIIKNESDAAYHAARKTHITASSLCDWQACPATYKARLDGLIPPSAAFEIGTALHCAVLEPQRYAETYITGGPVNAATGTAYGRQTKAYAAWLAEQPADVEVISENDAETVSLMRESVLKHPLLDFLSFLDSDCAELTLRGELEGIAVQSRIDYLKNQFLVDIKTCADLDKFRWNVRDFRYPYKMGFYKMMLEEAGLEVDRIWLVAVEKKAPYRCGVFDISQHPEVGCKAMYLEDLKNMASDKEFLSHYQNLVFLPERE